MTPDYKIYQYDTLPSTNQTAMEMAAEGAPEWTVVVAKHQSAGRGRLQRKFYSPEGTGLYMSVILRPHIAPSEALKITTAAAVSVAETLDAMFGVRAEIKWVNDILVEGKKVCGILTESRLSGSDLEFAVLGIGINLAPPTGGFPEEIKEIAGAVTDKVGDPQAVIRKFFEVFYPHYQNLTAEPCSFFPDYKARLCCLSRSVHILEEDGTRKQGVAVDLAPDFSLKVALEDGGVKSLRAGEISLRLS